MDLVGIKQRSYHIFLVGTEFTFAERQFSMSFCSAARILSAKKLLVLGCVLSIHLQFWIPEVPLHSPAMVRELRALLISDAILF